MKPLKVLFAGIPIEFSSHDYAEALCLYLETAEQMPLYNCIVFHGTATEYGGKAYMYAELGGICFCRRARMTE